MPARRAWDVFCRVVDNLGDVGVCWRLSRRLAALGQDVRLWIDDASALDWMAADGAAAGVRVMPWRDAASADAGEVVVEAFGCDPEPGFIERMAKRPTPPVWINLEYLSAEPYVERSHALPSPQSAGPGRGMVKWFFYPGFTARTGGLLREDDLDARRAAFDAQAWLASQGVRRRAGELLLCLFAYPHAPWRMLLASLAPRPCCVLAPPGALQAHLLEAELPAHVRLLALPWLSQLEFDQLLWSCDINAVRGEDSLVRALWAGKPFVWQLYEQHDGAHGAKLEAFAARVGAAQVPGLPELWRGWNGLSPGPWALPSVQPWQQFSGRLTAEFEAQTRTHGDLGLALLAFAASRRGPAS